MIEIFKKIKNDLIVNASFIKLVINNTDKIKDIENGR